MKTWTTHTTVAGPPHEVLQLLTEPDAIARWAPISFEVTDLPGHRLRTGTRARIAGGLAGRRLEFDVDVQEAANGRLALRATGPIEIDVEYVATPVASGSDLRASVRVNGRGLAGRLLATATDALLSAGALSTAVRGIERALVVSRPS
jgi:hypothetical protein